MAKPTAFEMPWPRGPVVTSIPDGNIIIYAQRYRDWCRTVSVVSLGVTGSQRVDLAERLKIIQR
jgi:hypothetical protein